MFGRSYNFRNRTRCDPTEPRSCQLILVQVNSLLEYVFSQMKPDENHFRMLTST